MSSPHSSQIRIRSFESRDLDPIVALWNRCLNKDAIDTDRFWRLFLLDPNFRPDGTLVAELDNQIVGFLQAIARRVSDGIHTASSTHGYVTVFFVDPAHRRNGIGRTLMDRGLDYLRGHGCRTVSCNGYAPYYVSPGIDVEYRDARRFMEAAGFKKVADPVAMRMSLQDAVTPPDVVARLAALAQDGVAIRLFEMSDTLHLLQFAETHFDYWHQSLLAGLQSERNNVFVAIRGKDVLGFAQWENPLTDPPLGAPGRFGPFGVRPDLRGVGLGSAIFYKVIEHVVKRGAQELWFGWAGGRNLSFYERAGCHIDRRYAFYRRDLT
ncbi:MAG: GNAT family N-acetyltransferase [Fimbriimonas sp.]|nr:GNAT family N-acetyltransferase [Fimbriimonas sp.]